MKLRFSTSDYSAISEYIAIMGGLKEPSDEEIQEIMDALDNFDALNDLVFLGVNE